MYPIPLLPKAKHIKNILNDATVIDVRSPEEFSEGHYPGAVNIPLTEIQQRLVDIKAMKQPIVAYCRSGARSGMAVTILKQGGIAETFNGGGLSDLLQQKDN